MKRGETEKPGEGEDGENVKLEKKSSLSVLQLFRYGDGFDKMLVLLGILGSIGEGMIIPLTMMVLSGMMNSFGGEDNFSYAVINKFTFRLLRVALYVGTSAFMEGFCWTRTAGRQVSHIRSKYLKSVLRQDVGFFDMQNTATYQVVSSISADANTIQDVISDKIPCFVMNISTFFVSVAVAFYMSWRMALIGVPLTFLFVIPAGIYGKRLMGVAMKMKEAYGVAGGIAEQAASSIRTVFSYVGENRTMEKFCGALDKTLELGIKQGFMKGVVIGSMGMIFTVWAFQAWYGSELVIKGATGGDVFVSEICTIVGGLGIMSALPNLRHFSEATVAASKIFKMIDKLPVIDSDDDKGVTLKKVKGKIQFKEVNFAYPSRPETPILQAFSLKVLPGQTIGLVGGSGSGKSTVISLLQRFYDPIGGDILLDGKSITRFKLKWLRSQMGLVSQEPVLFATSIKENIMFGNESASMEQIMIAAKAANAHNFINQLSNRYDTQVGELGVQLSGGQKQRIAIARALIKDPKILLLDEATSALDSQSERIVQDALDQATLGRTTIIVAHRLSTLHKADSIGVLESGRLVEYGSHDELMQMDNGNGAYSKMLQLQQAALRNEPPASPMAFFFEKGDNSNKRLISLRASSPLSSRNSSPAYSFSQDGDRKPKADPNKYPPPSQWRLLQLNSPEWKNSLFGCIGTISFGALNTVHSYCLGSLLSVYFVEDNNLLKSKTRLYCFIFVSLAVITFITNLLQHYNFAVMGERLTKRVREKMLEKILTFEIGWFDEDENSSGAISARLATEANVVRSLVGDRWSLLLQVFTGATLSFTLGLVITWRLGIVMVAMQPLIIGCIYSRKVLMRSMSEKSQKAQIEGSKLASEAIVHHRTITAFSSQNRVMGLFDDAQKGPQNENIKQSWFAGAGLFLSTFLHTSSIALSFWYGGRLLIQGSLSAEHMFQAFFILMSTGRAIADAGSMTSDLAKGADAVKSVFAILDRESKIQPNNPKAIKSKKKIKGHIKLKNVYFSYPSRPEQMIFKGLSLEIEAGKTIALVGQSGSGKSSVINLIERFYDPIRGSIEIDGVDIKNYNLRYLRSHIALVSQEPTLFAGTIKENIAYGKDDATETEIIEAATIANAHEFISGMKDGYGTYCGERGVQLSGGQKQRIALARAILKNPAILLLDEATSALDSISESLVQEALDKLRLGRTCIIVAHRLVTIQKSELIVVIENGKIVEQGSHSDLFAMGIGGSYFTLVNHQS